MAADHTATMAPLLCFKVGVGGRRDTEKGMKIMLVYVNNVEEQVYFYHRDEEVTARGISF